MSQQTGVAVGQQISLAANHAPGCYLTLFSCGDSVIKVASLVTVPLTHHAIAAPVIICLRTILAT
jgi:hypothetical protein